MSYCSCYCHIDYPLQWIIDKFKKEAKWAEGYIRGPCDPNTNGMNISMKILSKTFREWAKEFKKK